MNDLTKLIHERKTVHVHSRISLFDLSKQIDRTNFSAVLDENKSIVVKDEIWLQLFDLMKLRNPSKTLNENELFELSKNHIGNVPIHEYGIWVHYPWLNEVVHVLGEDEYIEVRTVRNKYKITQEEQDILSTKKVGVIGLSVGQSVSLNLAMERICGELRIADFDSLELSNMNRLRIGVQSLGLAKTEIVYREIKEIDPYFKVVIFDEGINQSNIDAFLKEGGDLDLMVDECDGLDVKVFSRIKCKEYGIPVVMETSDRGKIEIERYDIDKDLKIFNGKIDSEIDINSLANINSSIECLPVLSKIAEIEKVSERMKTSINQLGKTITTWPQLCSDVQIGGAISGKVIRYVFLEKITATRGELYFDVDEKLLRRWNENVSL